MYVVFGPDRVVSPSVICIDSCISLLVGPSGLCDVVFTCIVSPRFRTVFCAGFVNCIVALSVMRTRYCVLFCVFVRYGLVVFSVTVRFVGPMLGYVGV